MFRVLWLTLLSLSIADSLLTFDTYDFRMIQAHCWKLCEVRIDISDNEAPKLTSFLSSLDEQLRFANVSSLRDKQQETVITKCPHIRWDYLIDCEKKPVTSIQGCGCDINHLPSTFDESL